MKLVMGPILKFNGVRDQQWHVSILIVVADDSTPTLRYEAEGEAKSDSVEATVLKSFRGRMVYRYEFHVAQINDDRKVQYAFNDDWDHAYVFIVPKLGAPPRMAYASCNGFHSYADMKKVGDRANLGEYRRIWLESRVIASKCLDVRAILCPYGATP